MKCRPGVKLERFELLIMVNAKQKPADFKKEFSTMKKVVILLLIVNILLAPTILRAENQKDVSINVGVYTWHFDSKESNNFNRLIAFSYDDWCIGWFNNSYYKETIFLGYAFRTKKYAVEKSEKWFVRSSLYLGAVYGYGDKLPLHVAGISPFLLPVGEIGYGCISLEVGIIPLPGSSGFVTGMLKYSF